MEESVLISRRIVRLAALRWASTLSVVAFVATPLVMAVLHFFALFGSPPTKVPPMIAWVIAPLVVVVTTFIFVFVSCLIFNVVATFTGGVIYVAKDEL